MCAMLCALLSFLNVSSLPSSTFFPYTTLFRSNLGHLDEIGDGLRFHLSHGLSSVHLHRRFREPGLCGHLLIHQSARHQSHRSEEHTSELQSLTNLVCRLLLEKKNKSHINHYSL